MDCAPSLEDIYLDTEAFDTSKCNPQATFTQKEGEALWDLLGIKIRPVVLPTASMIFKEKNSLHNTRILRYPQSLLVLFPSSVYKHFDAKLLDQNIIHLIPPQHDEDCWCEDGHNKLAKKACWACDRSFAFYKITMRPTQVDPWVMQSLFTGPRKTTDLMTKAFIMKNFIEEHNPTAFPAASLPQRTLYTILARMDPILHALHAPTRAKPVAFIVNLPAKPL